MSVWQKYEYCGQIIMETLPAELFDAIAPDPRGLLHRGLTPVQLRALYNTSAAIRCRLRERMISAEHVFKCGQIALTRSRPAYICAGEWAAPEWCTRRSFEITTSDVRQYILDECECCIMFIQGDHVDKWNRHRLAFHRVYYTAVLWILTHHHGRWMGPCVVYRYTYTQVAAPLDTLASKIITKTPEFEGIIKCVDPIFKI